MNRWLEEFAAAELEGCSVEELKELRLAVLCGGRSPEREVSLSSGKTAYEALRERGYNAVLYDLDDRFYLDALKGKFDAVFILLHGAPGEDGTVQGFLELLEVPYAGSEVAASSIGMDKILTKSIFIANGLPVVPFVSFCIAGKHWSEPGAAALIEEGRETLEKLLESLSSKLPLVVKPARLGSSVGVSLAFSRQELESAVKEALKYDCCVIFEQYIEAREIQCGILGRKKTFALPLIEIIPKRRFFDYEAKYVPGEAEEIAPAPLDPKVSADGQKVALKAFRALGCRDFARVDMFLDGNNRFYLSEVNTIPGMTPNSLVPKEARALGISYPELVELIALPALYEAYLKK